MRLVTLMLLVTVGCQFKGDPESRRAADAGPWPFRPARMRIHPFTAFQVSDGKIALEARIELLDPVGDVTKGVGEFRFELYTGSPRESKEGERRRLYQWQATITSLGANAMHWDPITRTYRFTLKLDGPPPADTTLHLHAQFDAPSGERLTADAQIENVAAD